MTIELNEQQAKVLLEVCEKTTVQGRAARVILTSIEDLLAAALQAEPKEE